MQELALPYRPTGYPVEFLSLGGIGPGVPVRATVSDFGPQLLARVLGANETQEQSLALVFRFADEHGLALVDLADLRALLTFLGSEEGKDELARLGGVSSQTIGVLLRQLAGLEDGGGKEFFGEPLYEITDLMRTAADGRGFISALELASLQDRPALFSTALMWLLAELFEQLPEVGDLDKPKLVFFFDEAHLLFDAATKAFRDEVTRTVRMIRSKGVGVFFVTQAPTDLPSEVLGQLGARIQHALRAFTPEDADALKKTVRTYPRSDFYDLEKLLTELGTGEAAVTILSERGVPTPVVHTRLVAPRSSMTEWDGVDGAAKSSALWAKYGKRLERESAAEALAKRAEQGSAPTPAPASDPRVPRGKRAREARKPTDAVTDFLGSRQGKALQRELVRGAFSLLRKRI
jgi:DNA double-strand break repair helicase HerA and related ATPase